jgi:CoA:oxalate CoA-transferase
MDSASSFAPRAETGPDVRKQPLEGIIVLDLGQIYQGPYCSLLLAMAGATVIKIEPLRGEPARLRADVDVASLPLAMLNSNKLGITLNLKEPQGRELFLQMVEKADIVQENFAPGVMDRLGLGSEVLRARNPRLIYASASGYGNDGPYRDFLAMDLTIQAMSGIMEATGFPEGPPVKAGPALSDFLGGIHLYGAILTALYDRERTGTGRTVEVAMLDAVYPALCSNLGMHHATRGAGLARTGNRHGGLSMAPYNVYPTTDGFAAIICVTDDHWRNLAREMGHGELAADARFATKKDPSDLPARLDAQVAMWLSTVGSQAGVNKGASHAIGHALGGTGGVPHGYTSCVMMPHVLRFNRPVAAERQALISQALGEPDTDAATLVTRLIAHLGLPTRLRDVGISTDAQLDAIAEAAMHDPWIRTNPRAIDSASVVRALLDEARRAGAVRGPGAQRGGAGRGAGHEQDAQQPDQRDHRRPRPDRLAHPRHPRRAQLQPGAALGRRAQPRRWPAAPSRR